jgi:hypothetical protein
VNLGDAESTAGGLVPRDEWLTALREVYETEVEETTILSSASRNSSWRCSLAKHSTPVDDDVVGAEESTDGYELGTDDKVTAAAAAARLRGHGSSSSPAAAVAACPPR